MGSRARWKQRWCTQTLTPLLEGPDPDMQEEGNKKESSWEIIREWFRLQKGLSAGNSFTVSLYGSIPAKRHDLRLLLGVLGCPLAPIPLVNDPIHRIHIKNTPIENSAAHYIIQQYLASTGCLKQQKSIKNMYSTGSVKMVRCETEISSGKNVKSLGTRSGENGCFVLWQMLPGMWSLELVVGENKVIAGSDGKTVWRHTPWLGTHAAKGPQRPLRRIIQGLDPKNTANLFGKAQCLGEKRIGEDDCFVLKVAADREAVIERSEGPAEVLRHVLYGYFCQKSGLLIYLEDSHLTRVQTPENETIYWETTIGSSIGDYRDVDGVLIAHQGRSIATVFRFEELSVQHSRTRMEEVWRIDDVVFNVQGLSMDSFIPPADIFDASP
ncbi:PLANT/T8K14-16 PROTEIN [Salix purpurea]|uniref:PLANT/T8K14-16 PROTEIN n=2 Tax=Salix TaxID=40685 RepID=A0A9Q0UB27_SALPP|nr:C-type mannose receptor [Salix suchowensis]KAG5240100.1 C-type mannose receptor [Salix suchowensis]KAJ6726774.1 PLANT/T8K14-16 PROTEIN [Salix purpurea]